MAMLTKQKRTARLQHQCKLTKGDRAPQRYAHSNRGPRTVVEIGLRILPLDKEEIAIAARGLNEGAPMEDTVGVLHDEGAPFLSKNGVETHDREDLTVDEVSQHAPGPDRRELVHVPDQ